MTNKWITFDCFGTLADWHTGFANILRPIAGSRTAELISAYHEFECEVEKERPHRLYRDVLRESVARAGDKIGMALEPGHLSQLADRWGTLPVFADVEPTLAKLRDDGWKLAVLTNCDVDLFSEVQKSFLHPFDLVVTAEQVKDYKPSLAHFRYFWRTSGVERQNWVHAACSYYHDIRPAKEMDIQRIWIDRDNTGEDPALATRRIWSASELPTAAASLCRRLNQETRLNA